MSNLIEFKSRASRIGCPDVLSPSLSHREWEVLHRIGDEPDALNRIIAEDMGVSVNTVRALLRTAFIKTGLSSRWQVREWLAERERKAA